MISSRGNASSSSALRRSVTAFVVVLIHAGLIFGPLYLVTLLDRRKPKDEMFRVKIGGPELSKGPLVGMPERIPPRPPSVPAEPALPPPPQKKIPTEPRLPVIKPKAKPEPKPKTKAKPRQIPKKRVKTPPKKQNRPEPRMPAVKPKRKSSPEPRLPVVKPRPRPKVKKKTSPRRDPMDEVYKEPGPPILNPKVPVGKRNRSQQYAPKADNRTPGGGRKVSEAAWTQYGKNVEHYIYSRWVEPSRSLLGGTFPETLIELTVAANGKVTAAKIVRPSGSRPMEVSVQALLSGLDLLPRPPEGPVTFRITLKTR